MRKFIGINFLEERSPDATTLLYFRYLVEKNGIGKLYFDAIKNGLEKCGRIMHGGTIVDTTILAAPSSTKNASKERRKFSTFRLMESPNRPVFDQNNPPELLARLQMAFNQRILNKLYR